MVKLNVNIGNLKLKNPVMTASGTFGYGTEYADFIDLSKLGGIIVKGTSKGMASANRKIPADIKKDMQEARVKEYTESDLSKILKQRDLD